jgi:hypothetical protein
MGTQTSPVEVKPASRECRRPPSFPHRNVRAEGDAGVACEEWPAALKSLHRESMIPRIFCTFWVCMPDLQSCLQS